MEEMKGHIRHVMLSEFMNNKNATETAKKISSVYGKGVIIDRQGFQSFVQGIRHWKMTIDQDAHKTSIKML